MCLPGRPLPASRDLLSELCTASSHVSCTIVGISSFTLALDLQSLKSLAFIKYQLSCEILNNINVLLIMVTFD